MYDKYNFLSNGGAIFYKASDLTLNITDTTITNNSSDNYGGGMYISKDALGTYFYGVVVIKDNTGKSNRNNVTLQISEQLKLIKSSGEISSCQKLEDGSEIYIAGSNFDRGLELVRQVNSNSAQYFKSDNSKLDVIVIEDDNFHKHLYSVSK